MAVVFARWQASFGGYTDIKIMKTGFKLSIIAMLGIGGKKLSSEHIRDTAKVISEISPEYFSFLTEIGN